MESSFLEQLPPALRAAVDGCPFDLWPWIDPDHELPPRPIDVALENYAAGQQRRPRDKTSVAMLCNAAHVFEAADLTTPRLQYAVWVLKARDMQERSIAKALSQLKGFAAFCGRSFVFDGVNLAAWARGELPDIKRLSPRMWYWLYLHEGPEPYHHNLRAIMDHWNGSLHLRTGIDPEHNDEVQDHRTIHASVIRARAVRQSPAGVSLKPVPKVRTGGSKAACYALELFWKSAGLTTKQRRIRWNQLPLRVREAVVGSNLGLLADVRGAAIQHKRIAAARKLGQQSDCPGGVECPRMKRWNWLASRGKTGRDIFQWYRALSSSQRQAICATHYRVPPSAKAIKSALSAFRSTGDHPRDCWRRDHIFFRLTTAGFSERKIVDWYNGLPLRSRTLLCPKHPSQMSMAAVRLAIRRASDEDNPREGLNRWKRRPSRPFDEWCYGRYRELGKASAVLDEYLRLDDVARTTVLGNYGPHIESIPGRRMKDTQRVAKAVQYAQRERKLAALAEAAERDTPPADTAASGSSPPAEQPAAEGNGRSGGNGQKRRGRKPDDFTAQRLEFAESHTQLGWREQADEYRREHPEDADFPADRREGADVLRRLHDYWSNKGKRPARKSPKAGKSAKITA